jgi:putative FmdB family regulatory protein
MPIYEYVCEKCRREFSLLRPMSEADFPTACEECGHARTKRKLSLFSARTGEGTAVAGTSGGSCSGCAGGSCGSCGQG